MALQDAQVQNAPSLAPNGPPSSRRTGEDQVAAPIKEVLLTGVESGIATNSGTAETGAHITVINTSTNVAPHGGTSGFVAAPKPCSSSPTVQPGIGTGVIAADVVVGSSSAAVYTVWAVSLGKDVVLAACGSWGAKSLLWMGIHWCAAPVVGGVISVGILVTCVHKAACKLSQ